MAGVAKLSIKIGLTGLGEEVAIEEEATLTVPVEHGGSGRYIIHATAGTTAIQLSDLFPQIALAKMYGVYIKAEVGTIYVMLNTAGTTTFDSTTADLAIPVGEPCYIPLNQDLTSPSGMTIDAAAVTDAFTITAFGEA